MRDKRWFPIAVIAVGLFAINAVTRLVIRIGFDDDAAAENTAAIVMFALLGLVLAVVVFLRAQRVPAATWTADVGLGAAAAMLLTVLVGPFISGGSPFETGGNTFFSQVGLYAGCTVLGTLLGYWIATALGRDHRSRSLKQFVATRAAKPRRVVRR